MGKPTEKAAAVGPAVDVEPSVEEYLRRESLAGEFAVAAGTAEECFPDAKHIRVTLEYDPEEQGVPPTIVFWVDTELPRVALRDACLRFHRKLRGTECRRLCSRVVAVREL